MGDVPKLDPNGTPIHGQKIHIHNVVAPGSSKSIPGGRVGKTLDGKTINVRDHSSQDNQPTIEVYNPTTKHKETKFRY